VPPVGVADTGDLQVPAHRVGIREAMELAMAAASVVIHQLETTGTASVVQIAELATQAASAGS
jgi:hypothetical protein